MITADNNLVTFRPNGYSSEPGEMVYLTIDGDWTINGGLEPDVNCATVLWPERDKLPAELSYLAGSIMFWGAVDPDSSDPPEHQLDNIWLVDCTVARYGRGPTDVADRVLTYKLSFADHRQAFKAPRGGRLTEGLGNPDPLGSATLIQTDALITACLTAMGVSAGVPSSVTAVEPPRQIEWYGAHAPTELGKLLQHAGHVYCPASTGGGSVYGLGVGGLPTIPSGRLVSDVTASSVRRLPLTAVFTSCPNAVARTFNDQASGSVPPGWEFVVQDPANGYDWREISTVAALGSSPATELARGFPTAAAKDRKTLVEQLYKVIRLKSDRFDRLQCPVLREVFYPDGTVDQPHLVATVAVQDVDSAWVNRQTRLNATTVDGAGNLLSFDTRLGTVATTGGGTERADRDPFFTPLATSAIKPTFTVEDYSATDGKLFALFGFDLGSVTASAISEAAARGKLHGYRPEVSILDVPELRTVYLNDSTNNRATLEARAQAMAQALLSNTADARTIEVTRFLPCEIDGRINQVRYSQQAYKTIIVRDGWGTASRGGRGSNHAAGGVHAGPSDDPRHQAARSHAAARLQAGAQQVQRGGALARTPAAAANRAPPAPTGFRPIVVTPGLGVAGSPGRYAATSRSGRMNRAATGQLADSDFGTAGPAGDCVAWSPAGPLTPGLPTFGLAGPVDDSGKLIVYTPSGSTTVKFEVVAQASGYPTIGAAYWANYTFGFGTNASYPGEGNLLVTNLGEGPNAPGNHLLGPLGNNFGWVYGKLADGRPKVFCSVSTSVLGIAAPTDPDGNPAASSGGTSGGTSNVFWVRRANSLSATYGAWSFALNITGYGTPPANTRIMMDVCLDVTGYYGSGSYAGYGIKYLVSWRPTP